MDDPLADPLALRFAPRSSTHTPKTTSGRPKPPRWEKPFLAPEAAAAATIRA
jgi:hypothetical protein